jgi:hypothetical protein
VIRSGCPPRPNRTRVWFERRREHGITCAFFIAYQDSVVKAALCIGSAPVMQNIEIKLQRVERKPHQTVGELICVTFRIGDQTRGFDWPVWLGAETPEETIIKVARAGLHDFSRQIAEQAADWKT